MTLQNEIKGNLARLLATENLIVEHRADISTASFDVQRRVLQLPKWDLASNTVYDMLVGHEVGHALFTPNEDPEEFGAPMEFVNVIEDARIEKLIKRKYAGLPKIFNTAYRELSDDDFFGIADEELADLPLIDRINLHCKIGAYAMIPFTEDEVLFVKRTLEAETFEEVLEIAKDVYGEHQRQKEEQAQQQTQSQPSPDNQGNQEMNSSSEDGEEGEGEEGEDQVKVKQPMSSGDDGEFGEDGKPGNSGGQYNDDEVRTQQSFDEQASKLSRQDYHGRPNQYVELPKKLDTDKIIVDWVEIHDWIDERRSLYIKERGEELQRYTDYDYGSGYENAESEYKKFRKQSQKEVNYLVKEFECRKSADAYARAATSRTGVLDTARLHTYKYNEDLFKKVTVLPDGKNHGLIFVLDWSGSMSHCLHSTVKQLLNLTSFCKKVQIPFEVYAFTNEWRIVDRIKNSQKEDYSNGWYYGDRNHTGVVEGELYVDAEEFNMMNLISSRSNARDYERQCLNVWYESFQYQYRAMYRPTEGLSLSGTPLNEAVISLNYIIPQFKSQNDLQKVNVVILSDGESTYATYGKKCMNHYDSEENLRTVSVGEYCILRDRQTGRVYPQFLSSYTHVTNTLIKQVRDRFPEVNIIGIRLCKGSELSSFVSHYADSTKYDDIQQQWKKNKSAIIPDAVAYSALYALRLESLDEETEFEVASDASKGQITRAFKKMLKSKSTNKKVLSAFAEMVS
tara:strand:+ start:55 stop:2262 length:2208 start_codon:yes stop_codon:yes gene_type:complete